MEEFEPQAVGHGVVARPAAPSAPITARLPAAARAPTTPQYKQALASKIDLPKSKADGLARPPSAGLSAWEDDSPQPEADLMAYLGRADSINSGGSTTPRVPGPISGDGNLAQALLHGRKAAESARQSSASGGDILEPPASQRSLNSDDAASGAEVKRPSARLARVSGSNADGQQQVAAGAPAAVGEEAREGEVEASEQLGGGASRLGRLQAEETPLTGPESTQASLSPAAGAGGAGGGGGDGDRLRGLLYSDDDDGDEDYQDLMTADDDALFGGLDPGSGGTGGAARSGGGSSRALVAPAGGPAGLRPSSGAAAVGGGSISAPRGVDNDAVLASAPSGEDSGPAAADVDAVAAAVGSSPRADDAASSGTAAASSTAAPAPPSLGLSFSPSFSARSGNDGAPVRGGSFRMAAGPAEVAAPMLARTSAPGFSGRPSDGGGADPQPPQSPHPPLHASQHHAQQQYATLPTAQVGEGLRQHPPGPARRLYTPGQNNRSPVRGSGYVVSPAGVRPTSPAVSPGRTTPHSQYHNAGPRRSSTSSLTAMTVTAVPLSRSRSPRESHTSAGSSGGPYAAADGDDPSPLAVTFGFATNPAPQHHHGPFLNGHSMGGSFKIGSWSSQGPGSAAPSHSTVSRFPPASVQHFVGGQVYRSMPISQVPGSPSEESPGAAAAAGGGGGGGGSGGGVGPAPVRNSVSPGRLSGRGGRPQQRTTPPPSPVGATAAAGGGAFGVHIRDRYGSYSAPARPSTSPSKSRSAHGTSAASGTSRSPKRGAVAAAMSPSSATAIFGNGVLAVPADAADAAAMAANMPRSLVVPALPQYGTTLGIRHGGFKATLPGVSGGGGAGGATVAMHGAGAGSSCGSGLYGSTFSASRQKATDERMRSMMLAKIIASAAAKEQHMPPPDYSVLHMYPQSPRGGGGGGFVDSGGHATFDPGASETAAGSEPLSQLQRRGSLPHLLAAAYQSEQAAAASSPHHSHSHGHMPQQPQAAAPGLALYGRSAVGKSTTAYENGLPAVQGQVAAGMRTFSFDVSRRAMSRA